MALGELPTGSEITTQINEACLRVHCGNVDTISEALFQLNTDLLSVTGGGYGRHHGVPVRRCRACGEQSPECPCGPGGEPTAGASVVSRLGSRDRR